MLDQAQSQPEKVREKLVQLHQAGETVADILAFVTELQQRQIKMPGCGKKVFDICGTGGSGKERINLSTALAIKMSQKFAIAKHGNKAASGKVGSFDLIETAGFEVGDTPEKVATQLQKQNLSFVFAPAFHPALKPLAPIRQSLDHPTIFNYLGPLLNPVPLTAQMTGVASVAVGDKLAEVCAALEKPAVLVHDTAFGLDDVSIGGATRFWMTGLEKGKIHSGAFFPEDYGFTTVKNFSAIQGGDLDTNQGIFQALLTGTAPQAQQDFLAINQVVAEEFFSRF